MKLATRKKNTLDRVFLADVKKAKGEKRLRVDRTPQKREAVPRVLPGKVVQAEKGAVCQ